MKISIEELEGIRLRKYFQEILQKYFKMANRRGKNEDIRDHTRGPTSDL